MGHTAIRLCCCHLRSFWSSPAAGRARSRRSSRSPTFETGTLTAGLVDGQNKLVPSVSFHLQNVTAEPIESVQVNAVFRQVTEDLAWGDRLIRGVGSDGLAGGATGRALVVRSPRGYTGTQPRTDMLQNKEFIDVKVDLFARHGSRTWAKIGEFPIERKLLTE